MIAILCVEILTETMETEMVLTSANPPSVVELLHTSLIEVPRSVITYFNSKKYAVVNWSEYTVCMCTIYVYMNVYMCVYIRLNHHY